MTLPYQLQKLTLLFVATFITSMVCIDNEIHAESLDSLSNNRFLKNNQITSEITNFTYSYHIYLPKSYYSSPKKAFSIIYATDGQWTYDEFSNIIEELEWNVILVTIEAGGTDNSRRKIDYSLPGTEQYFDFFTKEFIPSIEAQYRVNKDSRTFQGCSLGGNVGILFTFMEETDESIFSHYMIYDPAIWSKYKKNIKLIKKRKATGVPLDKHWYLTTATVTGNHDMVNVFVKELDKLKLSYIIEDRKDYEVKHEAVATPSFRDTLIKRFGQNGPRPVDL